MDWLQTLTDSLASKFGVDASALTLSPDERRTILEAARVASHVSGERINAPLLCYCLGILAAKGGSLAQAAAMVGALEPGGRSNAP